MNAFTKFALAIASLLTTDFVLANPVDFTVESATGKGSFRLSEAKADYVVLHFLLKTECPYCLRYTNAYAKVAAENNKVVHIFLKPDSDAEIEAWAGKLDAAQDKLPIYRDPNAALAEEYGIPDGYAFHGQTVHYPALVILGRKGEELFRYVGKNNSDRYSVEAFSEKIKELEGSGTN